MPYSIALLCVAAAAYASAQATVGSSLVVMDTSLGAIRIELYPDKAPATVRNFLLYVDENHYDNLTFHRVIKGFMIQGGGYDQNFKEKPTRDPIKNESANGLENLRGTIAMARTQVPDSATDQFFINVKDNGFLDRASASDKVGYCVFGKVIEGMEIVQKIENVKRHSKGGHEDVPVEAVIIKSIRRVDK